MTLMVWSSWKVWVKVPGHWSKPPFLLYSLFSSYHPFQHSENSRRHKESRTNLWYWFFFFTIHWLEFKFKVENYSPWGSRNLSMGGTNTKSSRIRVFTVHWWICLQSKLQPLSGQQTFQLSFSWVLNCMSVRILPWVRECWLRQSLRRHFFFDFQSYVDVLV